MWRKKYLDCWLTIWSNTFLGTCPRIPAINPESRLFWPDLNGLVLSMLAKGMLTESAQQLGMGQPIGIPVQYEDAVSGAHASLIHPNL